MREKGGIVIIHSLSFKEKMMAAATELYRWQTTTWLATFSYFDLGLATVANQLRLLTAGRGVDLTNVRAVFHSVFLGAVMDWHGGCLAWLVVPLLTVCMGVDPTHWYRALHMV